MLFKIALVVFLALQAQLPKPPKSKSVTSESVVVNNLQVAPKDGKSSHGNDDIEIQRELAKFTKYLVLVGAIQAAILLFQAGVFILQRRTSEAIERAWVSAEIGQLPELSADVARIAILYILPTFKNSGRTVARIKKIAVRQHQISKAGKLPLEPEYSGEHIFDFMLPPEKPIQMASGNIGLTQEEWLKINRDEVALYVYGYVDYLDVSNSRRQTRFCFMYHAPHGFDPTPSGFYPDLSAPLAYTKST